jgi:hypothetical protein
MDSPEDRTAPDTTPPGAGAAPSGPVDRGGTSYRQLMIALAGARATRDQERLAAENWYAEQCATADKAVHRQRLAVAEATEAVTAAEEAVALTDDEATRLWRTLRGRLGPRASARMGTTPEPGLLPGDRIRHPHLHLQTVRQLVAAAGRGMQSPRLTYPLLLVCGVAGALVGWLLGRGLRALPVHGGSGTMLHALATLCLILAPTFGLVPAFFLLRRQDEKLTQARMLVSIVAGLLVVCGLNLAF